MLKTATKSLANVSITYRDSPVFVSEANVFRNASMKTTDTREAYRLQKMLLSPPKSIVCFFRCVSLQIQQLSREARKTQNWDICIKCFFGHLLNCCFFCFSVLFNNRLSTENGDNLASPSTINRCLNSINSNDSSYSFNEEENQSKRKTLF